jgi:hypothetical protein
VTGDPRPWWASAAGSEPAIDDADPVEAVRAARRSTNGAPDAEVPPGGDVPPRADAPPGSDEPPRADAPPGSDEPPRADAPRGGEGPPGADVPPGDRGATPRTAAHGPDVCGVCPICIGLRALGESRPELVAHLTEAARHLAAAVRAVVEPPQDGEAHDLERIDLEPSTPTDEPTDDPTDDAGEDRREP